MNTVLKAVHHAERVCVGIASFVQRRMYHREDQLFSDRRQEEWKRIRNDVQFREAVRLLRTPGHRARILPFPENPYGKKP